MSNRQEIEAALEILRKATMPHLDLTGYVKHLYAEALKLEQKAIDKAKEGARQVDKSAHDNPWHYIGAAALAGFIAAIIMRRR